VKKNWKLAWSLPSFRLKLITGMLVLIAILVYFPFFFESIENRNGRVLPDILLRWLHPRNVSLGVFLLIWACFVLLIVRLIPDPALVLRVLWGYNVLTIGRMTGIGLISLNPPPGLIPLADPLTNMFYGAHYITHDLFFSGHTASVCLIYFCLKRKGDRWFTGLATIAIGLLLLIQHVHYSIDVLAAPFFTYLAYRAAMWITKRENQSLLTNA
jgi:hypothetical protein